MTLIRRKETEGSRRRYLQRKEKDRDHDEGGEKTTMDNQYNKTDDESETGGRKRRQGNSLGIFRLFLIHPYSLTNCCWESGVQLFKIFHFCFVTSCCISLHLHHEYSLWSRQRLGWIWVRCLRIYWSRCILGNSFWRIGSFNRSHSRRSPCSSISITQCLKFFLRTSCHLVFGWTESLSKQWPVSFVLFISYCCVCFCVQICVFLCFLFVLCFKCHCLCL